MKASTKEKKVKVQRLDMVGYRKHAKMQRRAAVGAVHPDCMWASKPQVWLGAPHRSKWSSQWEEVASVLQSVGARNFAINGLIKGLQKQINLYSKKGQTDAIGPLQSEVNRLEAWKIKPKPDFRQWHRLKPVFLKQ